MVYKRFILLPLTLLIVIYGVLNIWVRLRVEGTILPASLTASPQATVRATAKTAEDDGLSDCRLFKSNNSYSVSCGLDDVMTCHKLSDRVATPPPRVETPEGNGGQSSSSSSTSDIRQTSDSVIVNNGNSGDDDECPLRLTKPPKNLNCTNTDDFQKILTARKDHVKEMCGRADLYPKTAGPRENFYFDKVGPNGLQWCPIFKAGSSSTNNYFCPVYYSAAKCNVDDHHKNTAGLWRNSRHTGRTVSSATPRMVIVRDPFERVLSAYRDKVQTPDPQEPYLAGFFTKVMGPYRYIRSGLRDSKEALLRSAKDEAVRYLKAHKGVRSQFIYMENSDNPYLNPLSPTFEEFVTALLLGFGNEHWTPINHYCSPCHGAGYTYILKTEDYDCEFNNMLHILGAHNLEGVIEEGGWAKHNKNPARQGVSNAEFYEFYGTLSDSQLDALYDWYKADCEMFSYPCKRTLCEIKKWKKLGKVELSENV